jgi:hypothetical protein
LIVLLHCDQLPSGCWHWTKYSTVWWWSSKWALTAGYRSGKTKQALMTSGDFLAPRVHAAADVAHDGGVLDEGPLPVGELGEEGVHRVGADGLALFEVGDEELGEGTVGHGQASFGCHSGQCRTGKR